MITKGRLLDNKFFTTKIYKEYSITTTYNINTNKSDRLFSNLCKITKDVHIKNSRIIPLCTNLQDNKIRCIPRYMLPDIMKPWMDKYKIYFSINTHINANIYGVNHRNNQDHELTLLAKDLIVEISAWSTHKKNKPYIYKYLQNFINSYLYYLKTDKTKKFETFLKEYNFLEHKCHKRFLQKTILI